MPLRGTALRFVALVARVVVPRCRARERTLMPPDMLRRFIDAAAAATLTPPAAAVAPRAMPVAYALLSMLCYAAVVDCLLLSMLLLIFTPDIADAVSPAAMLFSYAMLVTLLRHAGDAIAGAFDAMPIAAYADLRRLFAGTPLSIARFR